MIDFFSETEFQLTNAETVSQWVSKVILKEGYEIGEVVYVFCNDEYLHKMNVEFLKHDTLTDIISFDNTLGNEINGEIYISVERVKENAKDFEVPFEEELRRVMIHGILHFCGYRDKTEKEVLTMRKMENIYLANFM